MTRRSKVEVSGESHCQPAIAKCSEGDRVTISHEVGNPHDPNALVIYTLGGSKIGYVARKSWLQEAIHRKGKGCDASIESIGEADNGMLGVYLRVTLTDTPIGTLGERSSFLSRLFGLKGGV